MSLYQQWQLSLKTRVLYEKRLRQALQPGGILLSALLCTLIYGLVYYVTCFGTRYSSPFMALVVILMFATLGVVLTMGFVQRYRNGETSRMFLILALAVWAGWLLGANTGDSNWVRYTSNVYNWESMISYVNVDPATDRGVSFMDAGTVYFKENSTVLRTHAQAFRNSQNYCVAPIMRPAGGGQTANGLPLPPSGTVDFWAVGVDCCGPKGGDFSCDDSISAVARSGVRVLDTVEQSMYLLAVQEWSATNGLPVHHPLFFHWVKDPVVTTQVLFDSANDNLSNGLALCFVISLVSFILVGLVLQRLRIA